jgi:hypothetical protein
MTFDEVKKVRFGPGERVDFDVGNGGALWCAGTIICIRYRELGWLEGHCAAYQIILDDGCRQYRLEPGSLVFCPDDAHVRIRASGDGPPCDFLRLEEEDEIYPCRPLGYFDADWPALYKAHRFVEMLCAPPESVGPWSEGLLKLAQPVIEQTPTSSFSESVDRVATSVGPAGMQALVGWAGLNSLFGDYHIQMLKTVMRRPQTLSMLCQWIAHPPNFGPMEPSCPAHKANEGHTLVEKLRWSYTEDYKDPNGVSSMRGAHLSCPPEARPSRRRSASPRRSSRARTCGCELAHPLPHIHASPVARSPFPSHRTCMQARTRTPSRTYTRVRTHAPSPAHLVAPPEEPPAVALERLSKRKSREKEKKRRETRADAEK